MPTNQRQRRRLHTPTDEVVTRRAIPKAAVERMMVCPWVIREDNRPELIKVIKYPAYTKRNKEPASAWVNPKSFSITGARGAGTTRAPKFRKKRDIKRKSGPK